MRYKEFNSNKVLETCINLFWNTSFGGCSVKEIVTETGVNRFSLYDEWEHKEGILLASIDLYQQRYSQEKFKILESEGDLREVLTKFYMSFMIDEKTHPSGCYIIRIATELADNNIDVKNKLDRYLNELEHQFKTFISNYSESNKNIDYLAKHLTGLFCSLTTFCVIHSFEERKSLVNSGISMLLKNSTHHATHA
ncbi:MAG: hypothetical protein BM563_02200 [Bacteroidetes bacterium MedPE-SWsnd-G1]|nr:MAG: hypothetical protein BM563_02200 [Bacteroidetes bacterium MedPE-SWsnd-G1]